MKLETNHYKLFNQNAICLSYVHSPIVGSVVFDHAAVTKTEYRECNMGTLVQLVYVEVVCCSITMPGCVCFGFEMYPF